MTSHMRPGMPERGSYDDLFKEHERRIKALEVSARLPLSSIGEGGITVAHGGQIVFLDPSGDPLTILDSSGLQVGTDVVIDDEGLKIDGVLQPALAVLTGSDAANVTVTTTLTVVNEVVLTIPSWATEVALISYARLQATNVSGSGESFVNALRNDISGLDEATDDTWHIPHNQTGSSFVALSTTVTNPGATITCRQLIEADAGSHSGEARLEVLGIVRRT